MKEHDLEVTGRPTASASMRLLGALHMPGTKHGIESPTRAALPEEDRIDDYQAFGWLRGLRDRAAMIQLRKRTGNILAVPYGWLEEVDFDPSLGITLITHKRRIVIRGRNLNAEIRPNIRLFDGIARQRVVWVRENELSDLAAAADMPIITSLDT